MKSKFIAETALRTIMYTSIFAVGGAGTVFAQDSDSRLGAFEDEIVVTARKRTETVQDVPIAVTAFSGEALEARGITSIAEVGKITPNVNYQNNPVAGGSSSVATVYIRGIGQRDFLGTIDNGAGFYIDDVIVARTVGAVVDLLDVERVEVLRGPQGTLFGRNNVGGAIKLHTKKPSAEAGGYVDATYGTDNLFRLKGSFDAPMGDNAAFKLSGLYGRQDGYVDRPAGGDLGNQEVFAVRGAWLWEPTDNLEVLLAADASKEDDNGPAFTLADAGTLAPGGFPGFYNNLNTGGVCGYPGGINSTNPLCYNSQWESETQNFGTAPTFSETNTWSAKADIKYTINENVSLRSITAFRDLDAQFARDADGSPNTVVHFFDDFQSEQFSQELQLNATLFEDKVELVAGAYYFKEEGENLNNLDFAIAKFQSGSGFETKSQAVYSQATFHATDRLDLTIGGRYTDEDKTFDPDQFVQQNFIGIPYTDQSGNCVLQDRPNGGPFAPIVSVPAAACPVRNLPLGAEERETTEFTPMVNVAYDVTDDAMVYATYSEGFRSGGFVQRVFPPLPVVPDFGPEFVDSYEGGVKYRNGSTTFNAAAFFTEYTDIQVRTERPGFVGELEDNIGDAEIWGIELETIFSPMESVYVELAYGYTNAEYTAIRVEAPLASTVGLDDSFDHVPEHTVSGAVTKEFDLSSGAALIARIDGNYSSEYANDPDNSLAIFTPNIFLANANLKWLSADDKYSVTLGAKNLTNEKYLTSGYLNEAIGHTEVILDRGRQFFVSARANF